MARGFLPQNHSLVRLPSDYVLRRNGPSSETYGLLGRVYKDRWEVAAKANDQSAPAQLEKAIELPNTAIPSRLEGVRYSSGSAILYSETGSVVSDGAGNLTSVNLVNLGGTLADLPATGSYSIAPDCSGTAQVNDKFGTTNYVLAVVLDGQNTLFMDVDSGTTIAGTAQPACSAPQQAIVNAARFTPWGSVARSAHFDPWKRLVTADRVGHSNSPSGYSWINASARQLRSRPSTLRQP
jgi:hypothetical protein